MKNKDRPLFDCVDCKHKKATGCNMEECMTKEHRELFIKLKVGGCYYYDSVKG